MEKFFIDNWKWNCSLCARPWLEEDFDRIIAQKLNARLEEIIIPDWDWDLLKVPREYIHLVN
jgi:hypothetical protein